LRSGFLRRTCQGHDWRAAALKALQKLSGEPKVEQQRPGPPFGNYLNSVLPFGELILSLLNTIVSLVLISVLFAAIYKILPDRRLEWRDVAVGAVLPAILVLSRSSWPS
jgi:Virulence factor BrkB